MQALADRLRSVGSDVSDTDLVLYIAQGLGSEYENIVTALSMRFAPPSMVEFSSLLLSHEARLLHTLKTFSTTTIHLTTQSDGSNSGLSDNSIYYANANRAQFNISRGRSNQFRGRGNSRGRGRGRQTNTQDQVQCQICQKWGHDALQCYHRFDIRYTSPSASQSSTEPITSSATSIPNHQALLAEPSTSSSTPNAWYIDSGATTHVTYDLNSLSSSSSYTSPDAVHIGNGKGLSIAHIGSSVLLTSLKPLKLNNVLHVPEITKNMLNVSQLALDNDVTIEFSPTSCFIKDKQTHQTLLHGILHKGLYMLLPLHNNQVYQVTQASADIWHCRLGHCSALVHNKLLKAAHISAHSSSSSFSCSDCHRAKAHKISFLPSTTKATKPLEVVHSDLWGPAPVVSSRGHRYYVHFIDEFSRFNWIYSCACKSDVASVFAQFKTRVETLLDSKIRTFQCDGGTEYKPVMRQFPELTFQISCPHTPEQNGLAERKYRHIVELGLATMMHASIPLQYWDYVFESMVYVINRLPSSTTADITPFEKLFKIRPDYSLLRILGCSCYPLLRPYNKQKLEPRSELCVFLGYSTIHKGYYCLHLATNRLYVSRHVTFDEHQFPFQNQVSVSSDINSSPPTFIRLTILPYPPSSIPSSSSETNPTTSSSYSSSEATPLSSPPAPPPLSSHPMVTRTKSKSLKPKAFTDHVYSVTASPSLECLEPTCYTQAVKIPA